MAEMNPPPIRDENEIEVSIESQPTTFRRSYYVLPSNPADSLRQTSGQRHKALGMVEKSLLAQRPANRAIIFLYGLSGSGKTSTLRHLFHEARDLMATSCKESATGDVIEHIYPLISDHWEADNLEISWVDVPGFGDTQGLHQDAGNLALIEEFILQHPQLGLQQLKWFGMNYHYTVFPNIVMLVVDVNDERMLGYESRVASMFNVIKKRRLHLVDRKHPNVVIVLTHVCSLPRKAWETKLKSKAYYIKLLARRFFKIDVPIVYIENEFDDYELRRVGDFSELFNGEEQPKNLFNVCINLMRKSQDEIGIEAVRLFFMKTQGAIPTSIPPNIVSRYTVASKSQFEERKNYFFSKITVLKPPFEATKVSEKIEEYLHLKNDPENIDLNLEDELYPLKFILIKRGFKKVEDLESKSWDEIEISLQPYKLNKLEVRVLNSLFNIKQPVVQNISTNLGHGYDISKQVVKEKPIIAFAPDVPLPPYGFLIPGNCQCEIVDDMNYICKHYSDIAEYSEDVLTQFDLNNYANLIKLNPLPGFNIVSPRGSSKTIQLSFVIEKANFTIRISNHSPTLTDSFREALKEIPEFYVESDLSNLARFSHLFNKYGGFFVSKVGIGGYVQGKFEVSYEKARSSYYFQYLRQWLIPLIMNIKDGTSVEEMIKRTNDIDEGVRSPFFDLLRAELDWFGGDSRHYQPTLREISQKQWHSWEESLNYNPAILPLRIYPKPLYDLIPGKKNLDIQCAFEKLYLQSPTTKKEKSRILRLFPVKQLFTRKEVSETAKSEIKPSNNICFPSTATVLLDSGRVVCMRDVRISDRVVSVDSRGRVCFSPLYLWGHLDPDSETDFLCIRHSGGELRVSENHLVFLDRGQGRGEPVPAGRVRVGERLQFVCGSGVVRSVEVLGLSSVRDVGVYSPFTLNSCVVVNGIVCSVFAVPEITVGNTQKAHERGHKIMSPLRLAYRSGLCKWMSYQMDSKYKMHFYCSALQKLYYAFRPVEALFQK